MTPRQVDELTPDEYRVFFDYREQSIRAHNRAVRKRR